jgi:L-ascorbate metabolism protein UlaG (beta-lactamase superfamily)
MLGDQQSGIVPDWPSRSQSPARDGADFAARKRELDRQQRRRLSLLRSGSVPSWLWQWARGLLPSALGGSKPRSLPPRPPPPIPLPGAGECAITFIGHATTLIRYAHGRVLIDPCFAGSLRTLQRARPAGVPTGALEGIDVVLLTHEHLDHLHRPSLDRIDRAATLVVPESCRGADGLGFCQIVELRVGATVSLTGLSITAVPARHRVGVFGRGRAVGYVISGDGPTVYASGDTGYFSGFADVGARFAPEVAILPIGGYRPAALRADHLSPLDAVYAFEDLGAKLLVPVHYGAFALSYEPLWEPLTWLRSIAGARRLEERIAWLEPGESCVARRAALQTPSQTDIPVK